MMRILRYTKLRRALCTSAETRPFTLLFDQSCPLCAWEIAHYQRTVDRLELTHRMVFRDVGLAPSVSTRALLEEKGLTPDICRARMHAIDQSGRVVRNSAAFAGMWEQVRAWCV